MLSMDFIKNYLRDSKDLELFTCSQLRYYLCSKGFSCLAGSNVRKSQLLFNAQEIFRKYGA